MDGKPACLTRQPRLRNRTGAFQVLALTTLVGCLGVVAMSIDLAMVSLTKTKLQNAVDAAALAASQEISAAVAAAGTQAGSSGDASGATADANSIAVTAAKAMAAEVAALNGVYVDPDRDVTFGKRVYSGNSFSIQWGVPPYNVVKVTARMDNPEPGNPDSKMELFFAGVTGQESTVIRASAIAFVEARDIVMVLDYSGSMNDDSTFHAFAKLGQNEVEANMIDIYNTLAPADGGLTSTPQWLSQSGNSGAGTPTATVAFKNTKVDVSCTSSVRSIRLVFSDGATQDLTGLSGSPHNNKAGTGSNSGKTINEVWVRSPNTSSNWAKLYDTTANVKTYFGLNSTPYPYASGTWDNYIDFVRTNSDVSSAGYRRKYGGVTFIQYLLTQKNQFNQTNKLWKTPHYPFHAMKEGATLFTEFLDELEFGDHLGLVTYDEAARIETVLNESGIPDRVDLGSHWITDNYAGIDTIQRHKQAGHYAQYTNIGDGLKKAKDLLDAKQRYGSRPTVVLMTDGQANRQSPGWTLPGSWSWSTLTDYDGDGVANYSTTDQNKVCAFVMAKQLIDQGVTIHTLTVGADADRDLMQAIAFAGGGLYIDCPGGTTIAAIQSQLNAAFSKIAARVPPPKLLDDPAGN